MGHCYAKPQDLDPSVLHVGLVVVVVVATSMWIGRETGSNYPGVDASGVSCGLSARWDTPFCDSDLGGGSWTVHGV